jgi:hypothetical protein
MLKVLLKTVESGREIGVQKDIAARRGHLYGSQGF